MDICVNPYKGIDFENAMHVKSMSHFHVYNQDQFDLAVNQGYKHIASSHYLPSAPMYPLSDFYSNIPDGVIGSPNSEKVNTIEWGKASTHHYNALGSFATGHGHEDGSVAVSWKEIFSEILNSLQFADGGGVTINHPDDFQFDQRCAELDFDDRVLGIEIFNNCEEHDFEKGWYKKYLAFWDQILSTGRRCWGFGVVDWAVDGYSPFYGSNVLIVPELTEHECLKAYRNGAFYAQIKDTGLRFTSIIPNRFEKFYVSLNRTANIRFITNRGVVKSVTGTTAEYQPIDSDVFVRVEAIDPEDADCCLFTNPVMYQTKKTIEQKKHRRFLLMGY